jgi:pantoate--beta-alanine ligase
MFITRSIVDFKKTRSEWWHQKLTVALVPTMGALHEGHLSLIKTAQTLADCVAVSVFVNPTQFGPNEDFERYPRALEDDLPLLRENKVDAVFLPEVSAIYPPGYKTLVTVQDLGEKLCGVSRPTHFRGVATVVLKLFNIVQPNVAVFGQKDAQQTIIIRRMTRDLNLEVDIVVCPIVREADGLALSSRNRYLNTEERQAATLLYRCLEYAKQAAALGENRASVLLREIRQRIAAEPLARLDYAEIVDLQELSPVELITEEVLLALAVFIGKTRLIDNVLLNPSASRQSRGAGLGCFSTAPSLTASSR